MGYLYLFYYRKYDHVIPSQHAPTTSRDPLALLVGCSGQSSMMAELCLSATNRRPSTYRRTYTTKPPSVSLCCKSHGFRTANIKILSANSKHRHTQTHTHTHLAALFPGLPGSAGTRKVKPNLDFTEARDGEWQWHQLGYMQVRTSLQTDNHDITTPLSFFTGWMPFLPPNQQR